MAHQSLSMEHVVIYLKQNRNVGTSEKFMNQNYVDTTYNKFYLETVNFHAYMNELIPIIGNNYYFVIIYLLLYYIGMFSLLVGVVYDEHLQQVLVNNIRFLWGSFP